MTIKRRVKNEASGGKTALESNLISKPDTISGKKSTMDTLDKSQSRFIQTESKGLKEYFFEGIMVFLAVMLGFVSENFRENITEQNRAKVYAASMINDLKADTVELKTYINYMTYASINIDTLMSLLSKNDPKDIPTGKLYWYGLWGGAHNSFIPNDATFQQMKSSGSLRYFKNNTLAAKVSYYDQLCRRILTNEEIDNNLYVEVRKARAQIFEFKYNSEANIIYQDNKKSFNQENIDSFISSSPPLLTYDKTIFNQYLELVRSRNLKAKVSQAKIVLTVAIELIDGLKEEYHIE